MRFHRNSGLALCLAAASLVGGCSLRPRQRASVPAPPPATRTVPAAAPETPPKPEEPFAVAQTHAVLPIPQPVDPNLPVLPPEEPGPQAEPRPPRTPSTQRSTSPPPQPAPVPPATQPTAPPRPRIRTVESAEERKRLQSEILGRRGETVQLLGEIKKQRLSDEQKSIVERIEAFLAQSDAALREDDLREAEALSNRALMLSRDLSRAR